jgi:hypothetical protein
MMACFGCHGQGASKISPFVRARARLFGSKSGQRQKARVMLAVLEMHRRGFARDDIEKPIERFRCGVNEEQDAASSVVVRVLRLRLGANHA